MSGIFAENATTHEAFSRGKFPTVRAGQQGAIINASGFAGSSVNLGKSVSSKSVTNIDMVAANATLSPQQTIEGFVSVAATLPSSARTLTLPTAALLVRYIKYARTQGGAFPAAGSTSLDTSFKFTVHNLDDEFSFTILPNTGNTVHGGGASAVVNPGQTLTFEFYCENATPGSEAFRIIRVGQSAVGTIGEIVVTSGPIDETTLDTGDNMTIFIADRNYRLTKARWSHETNAAGAAEITIQTGTLGALVDASTAFAVNAGANTIITPVITAGATSLIGNNQVVSVLADTAATTGLEGGIMQIWLVPV